MTDRIVITGHGIFSYHGGKKDNINIFKDIYKDKNPCNKKFYNENDFKTLDSSLSENGVNIKDIRRFNVFLKILLNCAFDAMKEAGIDDKKRGGAVIGTFSGSVESFFVHGKDSIAYDFDNILPSDYLISMPNMPVNQMCFYLNLDEMSMTISTSHNSGMNSMILSNNYLDKKNVDFIISGSFDLIYNYKLRLIKIMQSNFFLAALFNLLYKLSGKNIFTKFVNLKNNFLMTGGCGLFILERREHALSEQKMILAEIISTGQSIFYENQKREDYLLSSINDALKNSGLKPSDIDVIIPSQFTKRMKRKEMEFYRKNGFNGKIFFPKDYYRENLSANDSFFIAFAVFLFNENIKYKKILINSMSDTNAYTLILGKNDE